MSDNALSSQIREGMLVISGDGQTIGKITRVSFTSEETYLEVWAQRGIGMGVDAGTKLYIPGQSVAIVTRRVLRRVVILTVNAAIAQTWTRKPAELMGQWEPAPHEPGPGHWS
jgi:hypothetical protein